MQKPPFTHPVTLVDRLLLTKVQMSSTGGNFVPSIVLKTWELTCHLQLLSSKKPFGVWPSAIVKTVCRKGDFCACGTVSPCPPIKEIPLPSGEQERLLHLINHWLPVAAWRFAACSTLTYTPLRSCCCCNQLDSMDRTCRGLYAR